MKRFIFALLRFGIAFGLAGFLLFKLGENVEPEDIRQADWRWIALGLVMFGFVLLVGVFRWCMLLKVQGIRAPIMDLLRLNLIGQFFNIAIPGSVSGDLVKMVYIRDHAGDRRAAAVLTVMLDRIMGLLGLLLIALIATALSADYIFADETDPMIRQFVLFIAFCSACGVGAMIVLEFHASLEKLPGIRSLIQWGGRVLPHRVTEIITKLVEAVDLYRKSRMTIVWALVLSCVVHGGLAVMYLFIGLGIGIRDVGANLYFLTTQIANAIASIPAAPGGVGVRDFVFKVIFKDAGVPENIASLLPILGTVIIVFWSLIGGMVFIFHKREKGGAPAEPVAEMDRDAS